MGDFPRVEATAPSVNEIWAVNDRGVKLDNLQTMSAVDGLTQATGSEQDIVVSELESGHYVEAVLDLSNMQAGDTLVVRQYMSLVTPVDYKKYAEETFSGVQATPLLYITSKPSNDGIKISIQQTAGTNREYRYQTYICEK